VEKWKKALSDAAELFGFRLADYNGWGSCYRPNSQIPITVPADLPEL
jgi:hypothetical protein